MMIALIADLFAWYRVNQKLISRYEVRPTPFQLTSNCGNDGADTRDSMKKVNTQMKDMNLA